MKTVAIVQARLGSSRLPGKVLEDLAGDTMLARVVQRLRGAQTIDQVVIATTDAPADDAIVIEARRLRVGAFRGSEHDVLDRYVGAARAARADIVVRITADCPLLDAEVIDRVVRGLRETRGCDYASNTHVRTYPRGLDVEAFHAATLSHIAVQATSAAAHEHVTAFVMEQPTRFSIRHIMSAVDDSDLRWTVDTAEDLALVRALYEQLGLGRDRPPYRAVVAAMRLDARLGAINAHVVQKSWAHVA